MSKMVIGAALAAATVVGVPAAAMATGFCCSAGSWCCGWCPFC